MIADQQQLEPADIVALVPAQELGAIHRTSDATTYLVHLVRAKASGGTPGPFLCGRPRFGEGAPGWSLRGGVDGPSVTQSPCEGCVEAWGAEFPTLDVVSGVGAVELQRTRQEAR